MGGLGVTRSAWASVYGWWSAIGGPAWAPAWPWCVAAWPPSRSSRPSSRQWASSRQRPSWPRRASSRALRPRRASWVRRAFPSPVGALAPAALVAGRFGIESLAVSRIVDAIDAHLCRGIGRLSFALERLLAACRGLAQSLGLGRANRVELLTELLDLAARLLDTGAAGDSRPRRGRPPRRSHRSRARKGVPPSSSQWTPVVYRPILPPSSGGASRRNGSTRR